jgi:hypothetical protein
MTVVGNEELVNILSSLTTPRTLICTRSDEFHHLLICCLCLLLELVTIPVFDVMCQAQTRPRTKVV